MNSIELKAAVAAHVKSPVWGGPPTRVTKALIEMLAHSDKLLAVATLYSEARSTSIGGIAVTPDELVLALNAKPEVRSERYPTSKLRGIANWQIVVPGTGDVSVVGLMFEDESLVPLPLKPKDARRIVAALPTVDQEEGIHLLGVTALVTPGTLIKPNATVALTATSVGIRCQLANNPTICEYLAGSQIDSISFDGVDQVQLRPSVLATAVFGVAGLAARKRERLAYLAIETANGDAVYEVKGVLPTELRARLSTVIKSFSSSRPPTSSLADDPIEQLRRLAELRDQGIVTGEEFEETKVELLKRLRN